MKMKIEPISSPIYYKNMAQKIEENDKSQYRSFRSDDRPFRLKPQILMLLQRIWKAWVSIRK